MGVYKEGDFYPINALRNLALEHASTDYVFLTDIDFLPSPHAVSSLAASTRSLLLSHPLRALVVPAFETHQYKVADLPESKAEIVKRLDLGTVLTFRYQDWPRGHEATNFVRWRTSTQPYSVAWTEAFEPYVVVHRSSVPNFDTRFVGFGWNKVSHMMRLASEGWEFVVLPDVFLLHLPHAPSLDITRFRADSSYRACLDALKHNFTTELEEKKRNAINENL